MQHKDLRQAMIVLALSALFISACSPAAAQLTAEQKLEDFEYLFQVIKDEFPLFGVLKRQHGINWVENYEQYRENVLHSRTDEEFAEALLAMLADLRQGHTGLLPTDAYEFFVSSISGVNYEDNPGAQLMIDVLRGVLHDPQVVARYKSWGADLGRARSIGARNLVPKDNVVTRIEVPEEVAYLQIKSFIDYSEDDGKIASFLDSIRDYPYLIIDIRGNGGGSDLVWMNKLVAPLLQEPLTLVTYQAFRGGDLAENYWGVERGLLPISALPDLPNYPPELLADFSRVQRIERTIAPSGEGFGGKVYLLVNRRVFSASEGFAMFAKGTGFATLVGQRTGGDGGGSTPILLKLPQSGLLMRMRLEMALNPDGSSNAELHTEPDITIAYNEDALSKALELIAEGR